MDMPVAVSTRINKPVATVFRAVVEPDEINRYFMTETSGPLAPGAKVTWHFADEDVTNKIAVKEFIENEKIVFTWFVNYDGDRTAVTLDFSEIAGNQTLLTITETGFNDDTEGTRASHGRSIGWQMTVDALKAWTEYGIDLRK